MNAYYFDTSIWLDIYEKRGENGECAFKLVLDILSQNGIILYSDVVLRELKRLGYGVDEIVNMLSIVKFNMRHVHVHREQIEEARKICSQRKIPFGDALHALLARENRAVLVSRDKDFENIRDICETKKPEDCY